MSGPGLLGFRLGPGAAGFSSTRTGGASKGAWASLNLGLNTGDDPAAVRANREAALGAAGRDWRRCVHLRQVHGDAIREAGPADAGAGALAWEQGLEACDAVFTRQRGLPLAIGHADCLAVVLADPEAGLLGLAHAGWRGALAGLPGKLARRLLAEGARPGRLQALLSPCLGPGHLALGQEQWKLFREDPGVHAYASRPDSQGRFYLDLWACARKQLESVGMQAQAVQVQALDTWDHPELFFSHRREQGQTGRMLTVAWLE